MRLFLCPRSACAFISLWDNRAPNLGCRSHLLCEIARILDRSEAAFDARPRHPSKLDGAS